jgi:hypothetical protein
VSSVAERIILDENGTSYQTTVLGDSPSLYWRLGTSGTTDLSGNGRNGTAQGGVTIGGATGAIAGDADAATDFDGSSDYVSSTYKPFINSTTRTFEGWAWRDSSAATSTLFGGGQTTTGQEARLYITSGSNDVNFQANHFAGTTQTWAAAWPGTGQWVHWVLIFNESADTAELFINGVSQTSKAATTPFITVAGNFELGTHIEGAGGWWDGKLDEVAVYESALSAAQILEHYEAGVNGAGRTAIDITDWVDVEGIDWGEAVTTTYSAAAERGDIPVDYRVPNRQITIPLNLIERGGTTFATIRDRIQAKAGLWQAEGGWIARVPPSGGTVYADVTNASLRLSGAWEQAHKSRDTEAVLTLEAKPDFYKGEVTLSDHTETTEPHIIFTETGIDGHYPGRVRIVVDEDDAETQRGLIWGLRSRHYSSATTARLEYDAELLTKMGTTAFATLTGAHPGGANNAVLNSDIGTGWTPILNTNDNGTGAYMTHTGSYRVWARVYSPSTSATVDVKLRFVWDVGDLVNPVENAIWEFPQSASQFYLADLGEIRLDPPTVGTHRWQGQIQAKGSAGGEDVYIDHLWFQPLDEGAGVLRAPLAPAVGLADYTGRDEFNQSAGALTGKTASVGGVWAGAGDADDFTVETSGHTAQRTAVSDTAGNYTNGRFAISGASAMTTTLVQIDATFTSGTLAGAEYAGVIARYTNTSNFLLLTWHPNQGTLELYKVVAGVATSIYSENNLLAPITTASTSSTRRLQLLVDAAGRWMVWAGVPDTALPLLIQGQDSAFATGGGLASGKPGFYDYRADGLALTRNYDNFAAWVPPVDAVIHASQSLQLTTEGMFREDSGGAAYGPVSWVEGDLPRIPPAHPEARTMELFLKASRGDLQDLPDSGIDDISARMTYRPCSLYVPEP